jgi:hypothetical protein
MNAQRPFPITKRVGRNDMKASPRQSTQRYRIPAARQNPARQHSKETPALQPRRGKDSKDKRPSFIPDDFDIDQHKADWAAGELRKAAYKLIVAFEELTITDISEFTGECQSKPLQAVPSSSLPPTPAPPKSIRLPLDNKFVTHITTPYSAVMCMPTVFTPTFANLPRILAPWPSPQEMKYEGDDRISTDLLHRRFLGAPRVPGNETVNWQHRAIIMQEAMDDFLFPVPTEVEIYMRAMEILGLEFGEEEGKEILGEWLWRALDPEDQFLQ